MYVLKSAIMAASGSRSFKSSTSENILRPNSSRFTPASEASVCAATTSLPVVVGLFRISVSDTSPARRTLAVSGSGVLVFLI